MHRREFLGFGVVFASGLVRCATQTPVASAPTPKVTALEDFFFLQLSDTHWGFHGPPNPEAERTLPATVDIIAHMPVKPDFVVFTGDLTHTTDDGAERRKRMAEFKKLVSGIGVPLHFLPGEHDAAPDKGEAYREAFGESHWAFDHKGIHFVALDNATDASIGDAQLAWLEADLAKLAPGAPLVVFAHRPLFELQAEWDWTTSDGARAIEILSRKGDVNVFYGHIHQEHHQTTGSVVHHSARSLVFPLTAPHSAPKRAPLPWDPASADHGLGHRSVRLHTGHPSAEEIPWRAG